jgi:hypothetical protein
MNINIIVNINGKIKSSLFATVAKHEFHKQFIPWYFTFEITLILMQYIK